ncbi:hypothetical protein BDZ94DRAFT_700826 [Collybia nuda]|uniref:Ubiquitin carboxyl-terminal hydrolase n=1 Tax=Collybia nuda TaxID=64659 RepID=A0A9P5Y3K9_9AGAR|nr:hypothetical protein BDZ94DRAFT_700826 [Collybia nuda]
MASPHPPYPGPSSYYPQTDPVYGNHSPIPFHYQGPYQHQQPQQPPRLNGRGGGYPSARGNPAYNNQNYPQHYQHQPQPYVMPAPQPAKPIPRPFPPSYANAATFVPSWQSQQPISSLPKQLSMPPPTVHYDPTPPPVEVVPPPAPSSSSYAQMGTIPTETQELQTQLPEQLPGSISQETSTPSPSTPPPHQKTRITSPLGGWAIWSRRPHDPSHAPGIIISPRARPPPDVVHNALELRTPPPSPPMSIKELPTEDIGAAGPEDDSTSPTIAGKRTSTAPMATPLTDSVDLIPSQTASTTQGPVPSSSTTEATDTDRDTPTLPSSPVSSSNTSLSISVTELIKEVIKETTEDVSAQDLLSQSQTPAPVPTPASLKKSWASLLQTSTSPSAVPSSSTSLNRAAIPKSSVVGISIHATTQSSSSSGGLQVPHSKKKELLSLLTSGTAPTVSPTISFSSAAAAGIAAKESSTQAPQIKPRGLVNIGNMCFANSVLQILVYCPPFHRLFAELGRVLGEAGGQGLGLGEKGNEGTPLIDATVQFLKEFTSGASRGKSDTNDGSRPKGGLSNGRGKGKGKGREMVLEDENGRDDDDWDGESFLPTYIYDAMKEKKRFDNMRGGQQEDAEEFLGFYLDTLEEELLTILSAISATAPSSPVAEGPTIPSKAGTKHATPNKTNTIEETLEPEVKEAGWLEVGRRNRMVVTRTIKGSESPITRIFGGKFRSTLRAPQQKDSVIVEDWRALRLDIQRDHIHTIQDALAHISHPQPVQVTHPSRPGASLEASQQVLIDALPQILVLHMKRFCYDTDVRGVVKVGKQIRFGAELDIGADVLAPAMKRAKHTRYKLFGVVYHHGLSASGGHYTLDVLHPNRYPSVDPSAKPREGWVRIDDELVSDVRPEDVFGASESSDESRCAYLLFYRRIR